MSKVTYVCFASNGQMFVKCFEKGSGVYSISYIPLVFNEEDVHKCDARSHDNHILYHRTKGVKVYDCHGNMYYIPWSNFLSFDQSELGTI